MKSLTVRYFAAFRENAGRDEETVQLDVLTTADVFHALQERHGSAEPLGHCKVAVNDEMANWKTPVNDGDVVLLFPPVAGG
ncbi:MAG: MoaD/ThiS family protein [Woeseia sp.]|nr:MoaD/ThiS family protein [Woeseia sp.]MBT8097718.1 MoaD/ThiS family protein [Woeseia sp.]NNE59972.1 MoaD/ThiS family protein [Woeseia sp.]NNL55547.1 MoaD/ThiS family protein [Woeseia sp.]